jgi:hypothetical protein
VMCGRDSSAATCVGRCRAQLAESGNRRQTVRAARYAVHRFSFTRVSVCMCSGYCGRGGFFGRLCSGRAGGHCATRAIWPCGGFTLTNRRGVAHTERVRRVRSDLHQPCPKQSECSKTPHAGSSVTRLPRDIRRFSNANAWRSTWRKCRACTWRRTNDGPRRCVSAEAQYLDSVAALILARTDAYAR